MSLKVRSGVVSSVEKDSDLKKVIKEKNYSSPDKNTHLNKLLVKQHEDFNKLMDEIGNINRQTKAILDDIRKLKETDKAVHEKVKKPDDRIVIKDINDTVEVPLSDGAKFEQEEKIKEGGKEE